MSCTENGHDGWYDMGYVRWTDNDLPASSGAVRGADDRSRHFPFIIDTQTITSPSLE